MRRRKKKILDLKYKIIFIMLGIILSIVFLSFSFHYNLSFSFINDIFYYSFKSLENKEDIIGTNINLELKDEIESLKISLGLESILSDFEVINGVVISRNPSYWLDEIVVNRGKDNGIEKGMCVVVRAGVVGYVKEVYSNYSIIILITNSSFNNTSVRINNSYLVLEYDKDGNMIVNQLDNSSNIKVGDIVLTSGLTDKYPSGITIGYVNKIENNNLGTGKTLYISLYYDIDDIRYVSFLKRLV